MHNIMVMLSPTGNKAPFCACLPTSSSPPLRGQRPAERIVAKAPPPGKIIVRAEQCTIIRGALLCDGPTLFSFWKQFIANIARGGCEPNAVRLAPDGAIDLSLIPDFEQTDRFVRNKDRIAHSAA